MYNAPTRTVEKNNYSENYYAIITQPFVLQHSIAQDAVGMKEKGNIIFLILAM